MTKARSNATANAAKGDLTVGSGTNLSSVLGVGSNGDTIVADASTATGLSYQSNFAAGKNKVINGDFNINQRAFTSTTTNGVYGFDRWVYNASGATGTYSAQTFTLGAAPVAGYESKNFARLAVTTGNDFGRLETKIESVRTFAGQTATLSFWAKGTNPTTAGNLKATLSQFFGSGGGGSANNNLTEQTFVLTANWVRYSFTFNVTSISGKTLGSNNDDCLSIFIGQGTSVSSDAWTLDLWGVQLEAGSVATAFQTATGTIQGELAACQRYYYRLGGASYASLGNAVMTSTTIAQSYVGFPQLMRTAPTINTTGTAGDYRVANASAFTCTAVPVLTDATFTSPSGCTVQYASTGMTAASGAYVNLVNNVNAFLAFSAEL